MAFTRDELAAYEKGPQKTVSDKVNPFKGATPAKQATGAEAAVKIGGESRILDADPGATGTQPVTDDTPIVDEGDSPGDPTDSGEGTSDAPSESSTDPDDPGTVADPNADLTATREEEEPLTAAPAKGSAQERIVELNDKLEGAMVFGKAMQEQLKNTMEENARLKAAGSSATVTQVASPPNDDPGPMPDMADADVQFDNDKYRAKMAEWSSKNARKEARAIVREMTGAAQANTLMEQVNTKVETYAKEHPDFTEVVTNNPVLKANQLAPDAGLAVARSPFTAELLMKFGRDPAFAIRVAKMHPAEQLMVVGEMVAEIKLDKKNVGTTRTTTATSSNANASTRGSAQPAARRSVSQASPPPRATSGGGRSNSFDPLDPNTSMDDFVKSHRSAKQSAREHNRKLRGLG